MTTLMLRMLEQQNEHFATYGLDLNDILAYTPLSVEEHTKIQKMHWSKKAQRWYSSVIEAINTTQNPYTVLNQIFQSIILIASVIYYT